MFMAKSFTDMTTSIVSENQALQHRASVADPSIKYQLLKRILKTMQWETYMLTGKRPSPRWLLKSPEHLFSIDALVAEFPDLKLVGIYRDPAASFQSLVILKHHLSALFVLSPRPSESLRWAKDVICRGLKGLQMLPFLPVRTVSVSFQEVTGDTLGTARRVAEFAGLPWARNIERRIHLSVDRRRRLWMNRPKFTYDLQAFGLNQSTIEPALDACP